jgi:hypothetical protein
VQYKLGKAPATPPKIELAAYIHPSQLPTPPLTFGGDHLVLAAIRAGRVCNAARWCTGRRYVATAASSPAPAAMR